MKRKSRIDEKTKGIIMGIAITLVVIGIISAVSVSSAHTNSDKDNNEHASMMNGNHMAMMDGDSDMTGCMSMMKDHMTKEEIEEMLKNMDKDGDGICDMCGMSIEACREMMLS